jgi:hypothetical protein
MSKFVNSLYSPNKSGRLGSSVFGKSRFGGPFEKMLGLPSNPMTDEQMNRRSQFASLSRVWGTLTDAQRTVWDNRAKDYPITKGGMSYVLSGFMFFMLQNGNLQIIGEPIFEDSPRLTAPQTFDTFSVVIDDTPGTEDITLNLSPAIASGTKVQVIASRILLPGRKAQEKDMRHIGTLDHTFVSGGSIKSMFVAKYGEMPIVGDKVCFRIKATNIADGNTGLPMSYTAIGTV